MSQTLSSNRVFGETGAEQRARFNAQPFSFPHNLAGHPLFALPRLVQLAKSIPGTHYDLGDIRIDQRWDQRPKAEMSIEEAVENIEHSGAWIIIRHADRDAEFREFLDRFMVEVEELSGVSLADEKKSQEAIVFVTSPRRITSYHIDRECNFLLQIRGEKTIHVFDRDDPEVVPDEELERFWTVDNDAAAYKQHLQHRARTFQLTPGKGVHIPVNCPHWLQNGDGVSISLSVSFQFKDTARANAYRSNYYLRKLGIRPRTPGKSASTDWLKHSAAAGAVTTGITRVIRFPNWLIWRARQIKNGQV